MISVITAVHNQLGMNKLFYENLSKYTHYPFELIVIDNHSTDGSREYFHSVNATVIENPGNYPYPVAQNQGIDRARYDCLAFLNNDIIVPPDWDKTAFDVMKIHSLEVACCSGTNRLRCNWRTKLHSHRWSIITAMLQKREGATYENLRRMHTWMYGNWERYSKRYRRYGSRVVEGFAGFNYLLTRSGLDKVGRWDDTIVAADFDIFLRTKARSIEKGDIKPVHVILGVYMHHYGRLTCENSPEPAAPEFPIGHLKKKWGEEKIRELMKDMKRLYYGI